MSKTQRLDIQSSNDIVAVRQQTRLLAIALNFGLVEQTKLVTAASELARNTLEYGGGGVVELESIDTGARRCIKLTFVDDGPGIPDLSLALTDGYTSGSGLGLGLSGAKRLVDDFEIESKPGAGTRVTIAKWK